MRSSVFGLRRHGTVTVVTIECWESSPELSEQEAEEGAQNPKQVQPGPRDLFLQRRPHVLKVPQPPPNSAIIWTLRVQTSEPKRDM